MNEQIQKLSSMNPYRNKAYKESPWQGFLSSLGFRTGADAWKENMSVQSGEYDAALAQKQFDMEYNDPSNQVARMRAAGINPDLDGANSISPGDPGTMGEDPSTPMQSTGDEQQIINVASTAANMIMNGLTGSIGLVENMQGVFGQRLQNRLLGIQNESAFSKFVEDNWKSFLPDFPDDETMVNPFDWKAAALKSAESFAGTLPKSMRKKFVDQAARYWKSAPGTKDAFETWKEIPKARREYFVESQYKHSQIDDVLRRIAQPLAAGMDKIADLTLEVQKHSLTSENKRLDAQDSKSKNDKEYYDTLDAKKMATAENSENDLRDTNAKAVGILNSSLNEVVEKLDQGRKEGGISGALCGLGMVTVASVRLWLASQGAPSISRSASSGTQNYGADSFNKSSFDLRF